MKQVQVLSCVLSGFVDPGQHLIDLSLVIILHELAASTREVMAVEPRGIKHGSVSLSLLFVETADLIDDVIKV